MILLGFADCVLNLKWRYKLIMPFFASVPLMVCYNGPTTVLVPSFLRNILSSPIDVGWIYRVYMMMYGIFTSNAINIYAGVNGIEVGQSIIIGCGVALFNALELNRLPIDQTDERFGHIFSLYLILPFIGASIALFEKNK